MTIFEFGFWVYQKVLFSIFFQLNSAWLYEVSFISAPWMVCSESWKRLHSNMYVTVL